MDEKLSYPTRMLVIMNEIDTYNRSEKSVPDPDIALLAEGGIEAVVIWEGSAGDCPWPAHEEEVPSAA